MVNRAAYAMFPFLLLFLTGCYGRQSALDPAGQAAGRIADLFTWMVGGAIIIWLLVVGLAVYAIRTKRQLYSQRKAKLLIVVGGALLPTLVLGVLLAYGLAMLPELTAPAPPGSLKVAVHGEQWWWRVRYQLPNGEQVELANELRLPSGETVEFQLQSDNVIHSFWIPPLGGKIDMIPGSSTRLVLRPVRTGVFQGVCAEYCGASHALMQFPVVVTEREEFYRWLKQQSEPAKQMNDEIPAQGQMLFIANGCASCHTIRGTDAKGVIGPDLTHVGSRLSLAAGILPNEREALVRWVAHTDSLKPEAYMPPFGMLPAAELEALAAYLKSLE
jgi:cytochrome c oxidase subunit II